MISPQMGWMEQKAPALLRAPRLRDGYTKKIMDRVLSQFEDVAEVIATGPGIVSWRARDAGGDRQVLIKRRTGELGKTRATQALGLRHPRIAPARRWLIDADALYTIRDWIPGHSLRATLASGADRSFDRLRGLLDPVLDTLDYAHRMGAPHGSISPENIVIGSDGASYLTDFGTSRGASGTRYAPPSLLGPNGAATARADYYALCEIYKEFLPERSPDDEAGAEARTRLMRNLTEMQATTATPDELRYKLDAITRMAGLLGFGAAGLPAEGRRLGAKIVCMVTPTTAVINAGAGTAVVLTIWNEGDTPLHIEAVGSDAVWLNYHTRFTPFVLAPDDEIDLVFTLSGARLQPGDYRANIQIRSNSGMQTAAPKSGATWHEQMIAVPVAVKGIATAATAAPPPLAERLPSAGAPDSAPPPFASQPAPPPLPPSGAALDGGGIACTQEPDPGLVRYGQKGVLHIGVRNIGSERIRIDKAAASPSWLTYPGEFQPLWIEPGATQFLGFSVSATSLTAGDYKAVITFVNSVEEKTEMGSRMAWREMHCDVRVRVVKDVPAGQVPSATGCAPVLIAGILGIVGAAAVLLH
ncbi:MAG: serine/threonine protein kinase with repeat, partial [Capsulimonas sp.]|nr:serine/threonine protein kinase with repeat [Capsulimonas sp.]